MAMQPVVGAESVLASPSRLSLALPSSQPLTPQHVAARSSYAANVALPKKNNKMSTNVAHDRNSC
jgi:hypothetical protein